MIQQIIVMMKVIMFILFNDGKFRDWMGVVRWMIGVWCACLILMMVVMLLLLLMMLLLLLMVSVVSTTTTIASTASRYDTSKW